MTKDYINQLKQIRKSKFLSIVELSEKMGVSQYYLAQVELGKAKPIAEQVECIKDFIKGKL